MYITRTNVLSPLKSGAKILTGTKTVLTNQARQTVNTVKHVSKEIKDQIKNSDEIDFELDAGAGEVEFSVPKQKILPQIPIDRSLITKKAKFIIKESMYEPLSQMGHATMVRNVVNPYNPKRKSKSIVDQRDRFKTKSDIYPKVKVDNSIMDRRVRHVRTYLYKVNGVPVAAKLEHQPKQPLQF